MRYLDYPEATRHDLLRNDVYVEFSGTAVVPRAQLSSTGLTLLAEDGYDTNAKESDVPIKGRYWKSYFRGGQIFLRHFESY